MQNIIGIGVSKEEVTNDKEKKKRWWGELENVDMVDGDPIKLSKQIW